MPVALRGHPMALAAILVAGLAGGARAERQVGLAPLSTVGDSGARERQDLEKQIAAGIRALGDIALVEPDDMRKAAERARRKELKMCDGEARCLAELGRVARVSEVVFGEAGGLGAAQVVYLKVVDVGSGKELRSTTLELSDQSGRDDAVLAATTRLLEPDDYVGRVVLDIDTSGASIFINGKLIGKSPLAPQELSVGSHALRITHPEYRDHVRWLDVLFHDEQTIEVQLSQYPIVDRELAAVDGVAAPVGESAPQIRSSPVPWYRRWYTLAGGGVLVFAASAAIVGAVSGDLDVDSVRDL